MKTTIAIASAIGLTLTPIASAENDFAFDFNYTQAELATKEGSAKVYERLENDVKKACEINGVRGLQQEKLEKVCVENTIEATLEKVGSPTLANIHNSANTIG